MNPPRAAAHVMYDDRPLRQANSRGPASDSVVGTTVGLHPCSAPTDIQQIPIETDFESNPTSEIEVGWGPPEATESPLFGYRLYWDSVSNDGTDSDGTFNEIRLPGHITKHRVRFLEPGSRYRFQVVGVTEQGTLTSAMRALGRLAAAARARAQAAPPSARTTWPGGVHCAGARPTLLTLSASRRHSSLLPSSSSHGGRHGAAIGHTELLDDGLGRDAPGQNQRLWPRCRLRC